MTTRWSRLTRTCRVGRGVLLVMSARCVAYPVTTSSRWGHGVIHCSCAEVVVGVRTQEKVEQT